MLKSKSDVAAAPRGRGRPKGPPRPNSLVIRGSEAWREWIAGYAAERRTTVAGLVDYALAELARRDKHAPPPER